VNPVIYNDLFDLHLISSILMNLKFSHSFFCCKTLKGFCPWEQGNEGGEEQAYRKWEIVQTTNTGNISGFSLTSCNPPPPLLPGQRTAMTEIPQVFILI